MIREKKVGFPTPLTVQGDGVTPSFSIVGVVAQSDGNIVTLSGVFKVGEYKPGKVLLIPANKVEEVIAALREVAPRVILKRN